jgi:RNA polymerase sigma factor (TIGR02999 family)
MTQNDVRGTVTALLVDVKRGDPGALGKAFEILYDQLRHLAHARRRSWADGGTLDTTALVHEAYLKLVDAERLDIDDRGHFLAIASRAMRHLLCDYARDRRRLKRGGGMQRASEEVDALVPSQEEDLDTIIALDSALDRLAEHDERLARVVECRFFAGLSIPDTAATLRISAATVKRDWVSARQWLYEAVEGAAAP